MSELQDPRKLLGILRERWWVVLVPALLAALLAGVLSQVATPVYEAKARLLFETTSFDQLLFGQRAFDQPPSTPTAAMNTSVELLRQRRVAEGVRARLGLPYPAKDVEKKVDIGQVGDSRIVTLAARDPDPRLAARIANTWADVFMTTERASRRQPLEAAARSVREELATTSAGDPQRGQLRKRLDDLQLLSQLQTAESRLTESAQPPTAAVAPRPLRNAAAAGVAGLIAGILLVLLLTRLDRRVRTIEQAEELYGKPVLGVIPHRADRSGHDGVPWVAFEEGFRTLRGTLRFFDTPEKPLEALVLTSAQSGDGKTTLCSGLAVALASAGRHVVCIDADLRRPSLSSIFGLERATRGLSDLVVSGGRTADALHDVPLEVRGDAMALLRGPDHGSLRILQAGTPPPNPAELLSSEAFARIVGEIKDDPGVDVVLIDSPPLLAVGDALSIAPLTDAALLAVRLGHSSTDGARRAVEMLARSGVPVLGLTVMGGKLARETGYYYYHRPLPAEVTPPELTR